MSTSLPLEERPELLAPAGDWDSARAAVENGADAIYFGLQDGFNARARAHNFTRDDLPRLMELLHGRAVRGYVTLNTLAFSRELDELESVVRELALAGVDAVLVQDLGLMRLIRAICPDLPIHASTQTTFTSSECLAAVSELGISRVVLPRELSIDEIRTIGEKAPVPLEAFVHGALCVAYSGQCLTSESLGGRSANRGQCAQACRLPYELVCDGQDVDLGAVKYLLSPQDLAAHALLPELLAAGVMSFKIEGRLKTAEYVANITRHYRAALDAALAREPFALSSTDIREMELSFSRGFSPGWLRGNDHKMLVPGLSSAKRGVAVGRVHEVRDQTVFVSLFGPIKVGDGVVFEGDRANQAEQGGRLIAVERKGRPCSDVVSNGLVGLRFYGKSIDPEALAPGQTLWKTDDPDLTRRLRQTYSAPDARRRVPVDLVATAHVGEPLQLTAIAAPGWRATACSDAPLAVAMRHPVTDEWLREQGDRFGASVYEVRSFTADIAGGPMVPASVMSQVRRALIDQLDAIAQQPPARTVAAPGVLKQLRDSLPPRTAMPCPDVELNLLVRRREQVAAAIETGCRRVILDFQDIREYREAVEPIREAGLEPWLATPRIQKPGEMGVFRALEKASPAGYVVRNLAGLRYFVDQGHAVVADFSLNTTNELTAEFLIRGGASRVTASYDLNSEQLLDLAAATPADWLEVVLHQHMPMFHMEHCVFCAVLSPGTNKTNCGRPCDTHVVHLRDRIGVEHRLTADVGCRNTLFNAQPQSGAQSFEKLHEAGIRHYRLEFLDETPEELTSAVAAYQNLFARRLSADDVWTSLKAMNRVGITTGTLEERRNPLAIL